MKKQNNILKTKELLCIYIIATISVFTCPAQAEVDFILTPESFMKNNILSGKAHEVCEVFEAGEHVYHYFQTLDKIDFNIHYHEPGDKVVYLDQQTGVDKYETDLVIEKTQTYCFMWENTSPSLTTLIYKTERQESDGDTIAPAKAPETDME